jgi:hypothetical protein
MAARRAYHNIYGAFFDPFPRVDTSENAKEPDDAGTSATGAGAANGSFALPLPLPLAPMAPPEQQSPPRLRKKIVHAQDNIQAFEKGVAKRKEPRTCAGAADAECKRTVRPGRTKCDEHSRVPTDGDQACPQCTQRPIETGRQLCSACRRRQTRRNKKNARKDEI